MWEKAATQRDRDRQGRFFLERVVIDYKRHRALVLPGDFDEASGHRAGQALLGVAQRPDAVFAANDMMALGCLFALNQGGVRVPGDIALAGFDDIPLSRYVHPALTTMRVEIAELGARAIRRLLEAQAADPQTHPERLLLEPRLVVRESS